MQWEVLKEITSYTLLTLKSNSHFGAEWILDADIMKEAHAILKCEVMAVSIPRQRTLYCCNMQDALNPEITPNFIEFTKVSFSVARLIINFVVGIQGG